MAKNKRQMVILDIIKEKDIETQEELAMELMSRGQQVTQATVSRDIKELSLIKITGSNGRHKYAVADTEKSTLSMRQLRIFSDSVLSIKHSGNLIVIRTINGSANAAAETLDVLRMDEVLGTIAGDNTIMVILGESVDPITVEERLKELLR